MRVMVDGTTHPVHDEVPSLSARVDDGSGVTEIQIADMGDYAHVVAAGRVEQWTDERGFLHLRVYPEASS